jgi:hypothetical protein
MAPAALTLYRGDGDLRNGGEPGAGMASGSG